MRRFYFDNTDDDGDNEENFDVPEMEFLAMGPTIDSSHNLLSCAIRLCEKSWFWFFLGTSSRLSVLEKAYKTVKRMTEEGENDAHI